MEYKDPAMEAEECVSLPLTFPKSERLRHKSLIDHLHAEGGKVTVFPLRAVWRALSEEQLSENFHDAVPEGIAPLQVMITIPKRKIRKAVGRVQMRRRVREAWRRQRRDLRAAVEAHPDMRTLSVAILYLADQPKSQAKIDERMGRLLEQLQSVVSTYTAPPSPEE